MFNRLFLFIFMSFIPWPFVYAQFPPPAGYPGTTAMFKDSSAFLTWATTCSVSRGYINIVDTNVSFLGNNKATYGYDTSAVGYPNNSVVSLGDGGTAVLRFDVSIGNGEGPDFAVFENAFQNDFLELGFVEVSSDGHRFVRFPAISLTETASQVPTFGTIDATRIHNFAGKYRFFYGTPFDLEDLVDSSGINLNSVTHVKIIDVIGCIQQGYNSLDAQGNIVNDPWPTPFNSCGLDLDAVGVIHIGQQAIPDSDKENLISVFPNPFDRSVTVTINNEETGSIFITDILGQLVMKPVHIRIQRNVDLSYLSSGIYLCFYTTESGHIVIRKILKQ